MILEMMTSSSQLWFAEIRISRLGFCAQYDITTFKIGFYKIQDIVS